MCVVFFTDASSHWPYSGLDLYYRSFAKDYYILKVIVLVQLLLESVQAITQAHDVVHHYTIAYTGSLILIDEVDTAWIYGPLLIGLSTYIYGHVDYTLETTDLLGGLVIDSIFHYSGFLWLLASTH